MASCFCCASSKPKQQQNTQRKAPAAPRKIPISDRQTVHNTDDDAQAVKYWRQKQTPEDGLTNTYQISKHPPLHPANGNILHPSVTTPEKAPRPSSQTGSSFERFQPTVQRSGLVMSLSQDGEERQNQGEQLQIVSRGIDQNASFDTNMDQFSTPTRPIFVSDEDRQLAQLDPFNCLDQSLLPSDEELKAFGTPATAATAPLSPMEEQEDHLSDVGSDVSFETKERYLKACRMLKDGLVNKQKNLHKSDRDFILALLRDADAADMEEGSVVSAQKISALETAASKLESVPDATPQSAPPVAKVTTKTKKNKIGLLACGPKEIEEVQEPSESAFPEVPKAPIQRQDRGLVRFDGWADYEGIEYPFRILGADVVEELEPRVLTPRMMEAMRGFFPFRVSESNFWLKFSLARDGASLATLLESIKASTYTIIAVETTHGEVFGSFNGTPWKRHTKWFGTGEAFLWRLKKSRMTTEEQAQEADFENEMEVFPYTGYDGMVQYCTSRTIAVGGGDWLDHEFPFENEPRGIGFMLDGDLAGGETNSSATFANPRLCKKTTLSNEFAIQNMEVWTLTPFDNEEDAAQLEMHKLFLDHNARKGVV